jgi:hypothetical protein
MKLFETEAFFDNGKWEVVYSIDGKEVTEEEYDEELELEEVDDDELVEDNELVEECCDGDCENCDEVIDEETEVIIEIIENYADTIEESECSCGCFLRNTLLDLFNLGRRIGWKDHRDYIKELNED